MMLYLYVLQNQWIVIALLIGTALTILFCLAYQALWLPRGIEEKSERVEVRDFRSFMVWLRSFMPWVVILLFLATAAFTVFEIAQNHTIPPNW